MGRVDYSNVEDVFTYQTPNDTQKEAFVEIRTECIKLAKTILDQVPDCADKTHALRCLREVRMWCNAAIALNGEI